ncbi:MAG: helix-turn-helix transcriptional regulator [Candidatus Latescibacteria bacterium]|nr:helix-turn-helix transcriptional regulator [Candidatus Latescibacterota bacterium]
MSSEINKIRVGKRIRQIRGSLTQDQFGKIIGVSKVCISNYERGRIPQAHILAKVAHFGHTTIDWLLTGQQKIAERERVAYSVTAERHPYYQTDNPEMIEVIRELERNPLLTRKLLKLLKTGKAGRKLLEEVTTWNEKRISAFLTFLKSSTC